MRIGICGAGFVAQVHAYGYAGQPNAEIAVVVDPRLEHAEKLAAKYGAKASGDYADLIGPDIDAVSICTPTPTHADLAIAAMRAGKHVLCEKPIARTAKQAEAMIAAAAETGVKFMVGHVVRYEQDHLRAHDIVRRGDIGKLRMITQSITGPFPDWSAQGWFADEALSGGPVLDLAIHSFDFFNWLFQSKPVRVAAVGARRKISLHSYAMITIRYEDDSIGVAEVSWIHPRAQGLVVRNELVGTLGRLAWDYDTVTPLKIVTDDDTQRHAMIPGGWIPQIAGFLGCIRDDTDPPVSGRDALAALHIGLAALESLDTGRAVTLS
jgi:predicted dehydrogenase